MQASSFVAAALLLFSACAEVRRQHACPPAASAAPF